MKKRDWILIGALLALSLVLLAALLLLRQGGAYAVVRVNGTEVARYRLSQDGEYVLNGGTNILRIEDGAAYLTDADCPDHLCVKQGKIRYGGETITCLPNRLTVSISGGSHGEVDLAG